MATAADLIRRSMKLLGVLAAGETPRADEQADGLVELNHLLASWANERLLVHGTRRATYTLTAGLSPHTIGAGGTFDTTRPLRIDRASILRAGDSLEQPLKLLTDAEYQSIADKSQTNDAPQCLWVESTHPTAKLWFWPVPSAAATLVLYTWSRLGSLAATDTISMPDGYENALAHALALQWAPQFGVEPSPTMRETTAEMLAAIRRTNAPDVVAELDAALIRRGGAGDGGPEVLTSLVVETGGLY